MPASEVMQTPPGFDYFRPVVIDKFLSSGYDRPLLANVFGKLVKAATPVVKHHLGDLMHDALWLEKYMASGGTFYYAVRECGTSIGCDLDWVRIIAHEAMYCVTIRDEGRDKWLMSMWKEVTPS